MSAFGVSCKVCTYIFSSHMVSNSLLLSFRKVLGYCLHFSSNFHSLRDSAVLPAGVLSSMKCDGGMACTSHTDHGAALTHSASAFRWIWLPAQLRGGESNGTPLQCSCLENPRDGGAWWAAVYGVSQSRTRLKRLSSSSSSSGGNLILLCQLTFFSLSCDTFITV